jgi:hypothetical protein
VFGLKPNLISQCEFCSFFDLGNIYFDTDKEIINIPGEEVVVCLLLFVYLSKKIIKQFSVT